MRIGNDTLITSPVDLSNSFELRPIWLGHISDYSVSLSFSGSPAGIFKLQVSNDLGNPSAASLTEQVEGVDNWTDLLRSEQSIVEAGDHTWAVQNAGYRWVRVVWEVDSGSGNLDHARFNVKGV